MPSPPVAEAQVIRHNALIGNALSSSPNATAVWLKFSHPVVNIQPHQKNTSCAAHRHEQKLQAEIDLCTEQECIANF